MLLGKASRPCHHRPQTFQTLWCWSTVPVRAPHHHCTWLMVMVTFWSTTLYVRIHHQSLVPVQRYSNSTNFLWLLLLGFFQVCKVNSMNQMFSFNTLKVPPVSPVQKVQTCLAKVEDAASCPQTVELTHYRGKKNIWIYVFELIKNAPKLLLYFCFEYGYKNSGDSERLLPPETLAQSVNSRFWGQCIPNELINTSYNNK